GDGVVEHGEGGFELREEGLLEEGEHGRPRVGLPALRGMAEGVVLAGEGFAVRGEGGVCGFLEEHVGELTDGKGGLVVVVMGEREEEGDGGVAGVESSRLLEGADGGLELAGGAEGGAEAEEGVAAVSGGESAAREDAAVQGDGGAFVAGGVEGEGSIEK